MTGMRVFAGLKNCHRFLVKNDIGLLLVLDGQDSSLMCCHSSFPAALPLVTFHDKPTSHESPLDEAHVW